jgi:hypothetical protein
MWKYKGEIIDSIDKFPEGVIGFTYLVKRIDDSKFYIGKKNLYTERNIKLGKKELAEQAELKKPGRVKLKKKVIAESDWMTYYGSNIDLKKSVKELGESAFTREILDLCYSKKHLSFCEVERQFKYDVLRHENCWNENIISRFFRKDIIK